MSKVREAVEALIHAANYERHALSDAVRADANDKELQGRIADFHAGRGEYADGGWFPYTGTAKLIDSFTPRDGCGAFDKAYQWACELVRTTPAASVDLPKLEAVHKAHHDLIEACRGVAERSGRRMPSVHDHCDALNQLTLSFSLYMPFPVPCFDSNDPYLQIAAKAATLADMYPAKRDELRWLTEQCDSKEGRELFGLDLKAASDVWDELERERKLLFALMVKHMPTEAKALRVIAQGGRWNANDKTVDITAAVGELRGIVVDARRQIGTLEPAEGVRPVSQGGDAGDSYAAARAFAEREAGEALKAAHAEADPPLATLCTFGTRAAMHATEIAKMTKLAEPPTVEAFIHEAACLADCVGRVQSLPGLVELWGRWPRDASAVYAWKAGRSHLEAGFDFARGLHDWCVKTTEGAWLRKPASMDALSPADLKAWRDRTMNELRERYLNTGAIWSSMAEIHRDAKSLALRIEAEYERAKATPATDAKSAKRKRKGGRPGLHAREKLRRREAVEAWQRAKLDVDMKTYCEGMDFNVKTLEKWVNWCAQDRRRA